MTTADAVTEIKTMEEYTLFSLDRSCKGLDYLIDDAQACSGEIENEKTGPACRMLMTLMTHLRAFSDFEYEVSALFRPDPAMSVDGGATLQSIQQALRSALRDMGTFIEKQDLASIPAIIRHRLVPALEGMKYLLPKIRDFIGHEYAQG